MLFRRRLRLRRRPVLHLAEDLPQVAGHVVRLLGAPVVTLDVLLKIDQVWKKRVTCGLVLKTTYN